MPQPALTGKLYFVTRGRQRTASLTLTALPTGLFRVTVDYNNRQFYGMPRQLPEKGDERQQEIRAAIAALPGPWQGVEFIVDF